MSTVTAPGPAQAPATAGRSAAPVGRTRVTAKALDRVIAAVAAEALGVDPKSVSIDLADSAGSLVVTVRSALRVVSLAQVQDDPALVKRTGGTLLERAAAAQTEIRHRAADLSGSTISSVTVRLTGIDIQPETRAK